MTGAGIIGEGVMGEGVTGDGVIGDGVTGDGVTGEGVIGAGVAGAGVTGAGVTGAGVTGEGVAGEGVVRGTDVIGTGVLSPPDSSSLQFLAAERLVRSSLLLHLRSRAGLEVPLNPPRSRALSSPLVVRRFRPVPRFVKNVLSPRIPAVAQVWNNMKAKTSGL